MKHHWGEINGPVRTEWFADEPRRMTVLDWIVYVDKRRVRWTVAPGTVVDGASVPWFFRRVFPAYIGFYRRATVLHDMACESRHATSWQVHRMFFEAMRCDGTNPLTAWLLWAAVRMFGPRFRGKFEESQRIQVPTGTKTPRQEDERSHPG